MPTRFLKVSSNGNKIFKSKLNSDLLHDIFSFLFSIESEAKDHNRLLDNVDGDFDSTGNFLSGTLNRVNHMLGTGRSNRKLMCYIAGGVVIFITLIYMLSSKLRSSS